MRWSIINNIMSTWRTYSPVRTLNGIHVLQQVFGWLGFSQADTKNRNRCTTAEKIWREMAELLKFLKYCNISAVYSPLVWGCAVWPKSSCSTERLFRLSVCFDQAAATAGWQRFGQFFPVWICVFRYSLRYRDPYDLRKIAEDTWISFCFVNEFRSQAWFGSKIRSLYLPSMLDCFFKSDFSNMNIVPELIPSRTVESDFGLYRCSISTTSHVLIMHRRNQRVYTVIYDINDLMMYIFFCVLIDWRLRLGVKMESSLYEYKKPILRGKTPAHLPVCRCSEGAFWGADVAWWTEGRSFTCYMVGIQHTGLFSQGASWSQIYDRVGLGIK